MDAFLRELREPEKEVVAPILRVQTSLLGSSPRLEKTEDFLMYSFVSVTPYRCPFELHFGRQKSEGRFNFYFGLGSEIYNYETLDDSTKSEFADDVLQFLTYTISCDEHVTAKGVVREKYRLSKLATDGQPIPFVYKNYSWPPLRYQKRRVEFVPWITLGAKERSPLRRRSSSCAPGFPPTGSTCS